jgi:CheY-like chemotaxis protein
MAEWDRRLNYARHYDDVTVLAGLRCDMKFSREFDIAEDILRKENVDEKNPVSGELPMGNETILFVDDEKDLIEIGELIFKKLGYRVFAFTDSVKALKSFYSEPDKFDLIITDLNMPGMTGIELVSEIMEVRPHMPAILCTGFSDITNEENARNKGIRHIVMKPFTINHMALAIRMVIEESFSYVL